MDAQTVIKKLGRRRVIEALGVSSPQISNRIALGSFPGYWFATMDALAAEDGWNVDRNLFVWKRAESAA